MTDPNPIYTELVAEHEAAAEIAEPETVEESQLGEPR